MLITIDSLNESKFAKILAEVYKLRARVFSDRLGWAVDVQDGMEIDQYDNLNPMHLVCLDDDGEVVGCMRLLQTTGPHMLTDIFIDLLDGEPPLRSAQVWEATRFCIDTQKLKGGKIKNSISYYTSELMIGVFEYAQKAGITDIVGVVDPVMNRIMKRSGNAPYDYMGSTKPMGVVKAMVALMDCSDARIRSIRDFANIRHKVFLTEDEALSLYARSQDQEPELVQATDDPLCPKPRLSDLQRYCYEQFLNAEDERDILAATQLLNVLSSKVGTDDPGELKKLAKDIPSRKVDFELLEQEILRSA